ncbi:tRNA synthetases class I (C) catalytic domain-containing protein [Zychaea mexicana]|uniref:tRNA synthetases class I (C) catalytic domain-containing protein n=1 Tax=Zychaea mexicana TaxID=64656 RepID=UPI0022FF10B2|nr:tRNA synthetases class I (C) catalytic domain-containing protein [Zychaea mexicana]KAI9497931.1 tRNA synthetases class I (C) catalytic domain-containing protein [Zychaea mexicana]
MASSSSRVQPNWHAPSSAENNSNKPVLKLYNSLTKTKTEFVPKRPGHVSWYNCGPTVYDAAHMGHARTYLSMDIIRRVMESYFGYQVQFVQNVTDIDDKIILRARQQYLFNNLKNSTESLNNELIERVEKYWNDYATSKLSAVKGAASEATSDWTAFVAMMTPEALAKAVLVDEKFKMHFTALQASRAAIDVAKCALAQGNNAKQSAEVLLDTSQDIVSLALDKTEGEAVTDSKIFRELSSYWEDMYFKDMKALNVLSPSVKTRVSEFVPEIVTYVKKIIANGYAYEADGSVYFDTARFDGHEGHHYAKLEPKSKGDIALIEDGEGSLGTKLQGKRSQNDFALWKASKPGEPVWDSPWGKGRPGWHIECSVMASAVLGDNMDIHSGGVDLAFPHHDNELAQSEAHYNCPQWVNYFLHAGHLHVEGQKMSKSLKNFITIQEALKTYSPRQLRIFFLAHQWNTKMDFKQSGMQEAVGMETTMKNLFDNVAALSDRIRSDGSRGSTILPNGDISHRWRDDENELSTFFQERVDGVHFALCDSINTPVAMDEIMSLINQTNKYLVKGAAYVNIDLLEDITSWISRMMEIFGVEMGDNAKSNAGADKEFLMQCLRTLSSFRDKVRQLALDKKDPKEYLKLSDELRDVQLAELGVALDDQKDGTALVKILTPEEVKKARDEKLAQQAAKAAQAAAAKAQRLQKGWDRLQKGKKSPEDIEKERKQENPEMSKNQVKKLAKEMDVQKGLHSEYQKYEAFLKESGEPDSLEGYEAYLKHTK